MPETSCRRLGTGAITYAFYLLEFPRGNRDPKMRIMMIARDDEMMMTLHGPTAAGRRDDRRCGHRRSTLHRKVVYSRCQERRTTFRHRFNCLLSNGSHRTLNSRARCGWLGPGRRMGHTLYRGTRSRFF